MDKVARPLMIVGLVLMLCAPAVALAQGDVPRKVVPCCQKPVIDGMREAAWDAAHWEDITLEGTNVFALQDEDAYGVELELMHRGDKLYVLATGWWDMAEVIVAQELFSVFCMGFDDAPLNAWNGTVPMGGASDGWLCFLGGITESIPEPPPGFVPLDSLALFIGRVGGVQASPPVDCIGDFAADGPGVPALVKPLTGVEHAFGGYLPEGYPSEGIFAWSHEIAIDLKNSPLNLREGEFYMAGLASGAIFHLSMETACKMLSTWPWTSPSLTLGTRSACGLAAEVCRGTNTPSASAARRSAGSTTIVTGACPASARSS